MDKFRDVDDLSEDEQQAILRMGYSLIGLVEEYARQDGFPLDLIPRLFAMAFISSVAESTQMAIRLDITQKFGDEVETLVGSMLSDAIELLNEFGKPASTQLYKGPDSLDGGRQHEDG